MLEQIFTAASAASKNDACLINESKIIISFLWSKSMTHFVPLWGEPWSRYLQFTLLFLLISVSMSVMWWCSFSRLWTFVFNFVEVPLFWSKSLPPPPLRRLLTTFSSFLKVSFQFELLTPTHNSFQSKRSWVWWKHSFESEMKWIWLKNLKMCMHKNVGYLRHKIIFQNTWFHFCFMMRGQP